MTSNIQQIVFNVRKPYLLLLFLIFFCLSPSISQSLKNEGINHPDLFTFIQNKHGLDQELINGIQYYNPYYNVEHHPFYIEEEFFQGFIVLSGKMYDDVHLNYDIYSQYLILEYQIISGGINKIILSPAHTEAFQLGGKKFEKLILDEQGLLFYQVIRVQGFTCYMHWEKFIRERQSDNQITEYFTDPHRTYLLDINGKVYPFRNRNTFASLFSGVNKKDIKKYMKQNDIHLSNVATDKLTGLLEFVSSSMQRNSEH